LQLEEPPLPVGGLAGDTVGSGVVGVAGELPPQDKACAATKAAPATERALARGSTIGVS
jgi:hypothetical protein